MGLSNDDKMPIGIQPIEAYKKIKLWYQTNMNHKRLDTTKEYGQRSIRLIQNLPIPDKISPVEIKAVFREVIAGRLEWAYHESDGAYKMAAYAKEALETIGESYSLTEAEFEVIKKSPIWDYIGQTR